MRDSLDNLPAIRLRETLSGAPGIVDLWFYRYEEFDDARLLTEPDGYMNTDERARYARFHFERDRRLFLATRTLVRLVLSRYAPVHPRDWCFIAGKNGKPRIASPSVTPTLHFNLSNTRGLVVCVVSVAHRMIGVDTEEADRLDPSDELIERCLSKREAIELLQLAPPDRPRRFISYWTLKECYLKAVGRGLSDRRQQPSFWLGADEVSISPTRRLRPEARRWQFALIDASPHLIAIAAQTDGAPLTLRAQRVVPLASDSALG